MKRNNLLFIPSQLLLLTLLCVDNIGKKRLTDKTFIPKKCDDIKWKLFDSFFFVVSIIRKFNKKTLKIEQFPVYHRTGKSHQSRKLNYHRLLCYISNNDISMMKK